MRLLYFAPFVFGGLADYAREQASALGRRGLQVEFLCPPGLPTPVQAPFRRRSELADPGPSLPAPGRLARALRFAQLCLRQHRQLARLIEVEGHRHVLFAAYGEYFAPLWSGPLRRAARRGTVFGAVVHDPIRDARHGPRRWHERAVADAYSFLRHAYVHEPIELPTGRPMPDLCTHVLPHGPYRFDTVVPPRELARARLGLPPEATVLLAFGHLRDNKNLDLVIEALAAMPEVHLLVAGRPLSPRHRPAGFYCARAEAAGVAHRCHWHIAAIPEVDVGVYFAAADMLCLTYSGGFRSASGVLSASSQFRLPCLASSGPGPLQSMVERYRLGVWVEPDAPDALVAGLRRLLAEGVSPRWDDFARECSWERNAEVVATSLFCPS